ncbi:MAG: hypothetical protein FJW20_12110 [Acidimicrobiia bacterium]|nr:hypothetical protein [Acidimicrobiia bacterium]
MKKLLVRALCILAVIAVGAMAADISGKWEAQVPGRGGEPRATTFTFKVEGDKLTGTMSDGRGEAVAIENGKVSGDTISFSVTTQRGKRGYTGTVSGSEIKFKREGGQNAQEFTAKRAAS